MIRITKDQMTALSRFDRNYNLRHFDLEVESEELIVHATLKAGKVDIYKGFKLSAGGNLIGVIKDEGGSSHTENPTE